MHRTAAIAVLTPALAAAAGAQALASPERLDDDAQGNRYRVSNRGAGQILARSASGTISVFSTTRPRRPGWRS